MKKCIIVGGGYSIKAEWKTGLFDKIKDKDCEIWSINSAYKTMPYLPDRQIFVDSCFFKDNQEQIKEMCNSGVELISKRHGLMVNSKLSIKMFETTRNPKHFWGVDAIKKGTLFAGGNGLSGFFALSYATALGFDEIYLLGYDFGSPSIGIKNTHFYQEEMLDLNITSKGAGKPEVYMQNGQIKQSVVRGFDVYNTTKSRIFNVSAISNIKSFEKLTYQELYGRLKPRIES